MKRLALLDRDGTINVEKGFLADPARVELIPGAAEAIRRLNEADWGAVIVTNQSGIGRGLYSLQDALATNARVVELLAAAGARVDDVEFCPHHPEAGHSQYRMVCDCRKPAPGMAVAASRNLGVPLAGCVAVGDRLADVQLGQGLGGHGILVLTGYGREHRVLAEQRGVTPDAVVADLAAAVDWILDRG